MRLFIIIIYFLIFVNSANAQSKSDSLVWSYLTNVKEQVSFNNYSAANVYMKKIFSLKGATFPDETAYYYGLVQTKLNNYTKGKEAVEKYINLTGAKGEHYKAAQSLLLEADKHICKMCNNTGSHEVVDTCVICKGEGKGAVDCNVCKQKGIEYCTACKGKGVFIVKGGLGNTYSTCQKCLGKGFSDCHICKGTKKKSDICNECKGKGVFKRKENCDHQSH